MPQETKKGQINIVGLIGVGVSIASAIIGSFFYQINRTAAVETRTAVIESQYVEVNKKLDKIILKLESIPNTNLNKLLVK